MKCDICGKEAKTWGHCVCLECYTTPKAKDKQLAIYKRALELACKMLEATIDEDTDYLWYQDFCLNKAKKELEEQDAKD